MRLPAIVCHCVDHVIVVLKVGLVAGLLYYRCVVGCAGGRG